MASTPPAYEYTLVFKCPQGLDNLEIIYTLFNDQWRGHQNFTQMFMAGQDMRMRFSFDRNRLLIPVKQLLSQWQKKPADHFFKIDPAVDALVPE